MTIESRSDAGRLRVALEPPRRRQPSALLIRLRHPEARPIRSVTVNSREWTDFDAGREWVRIAAPLAERYVVEASY